MYFQLSSTGNYSPPFHAPEATGLLAEIVYLLSLCHMYRARTVYEHQRLFRVQTQNGQLKDCVEQLDEFDKKVHWIRIVDYTFKSSLRVERTGMDVQLQTQNGQLKDCVEQLDEFDKKVHWIRIVDYTFKSSLRVERTGMDVQLMCFTVPLRPF